MSAAGTETQTQKVYKFIQFNTQTFVARITLNHPQYNVLTVPMMTELAEAIESLNGRGDIKCIMLDSSQKTFRPDLGGRFAPRARLPDLGRLHAGIHGDQRDIEAVDRGLEWPGDRRRVGTGGLWRCDHRNAKRALCRSRSEDGRVSPICRCHVAAADWTEKDVRADPDRQAISAEEGYNLGFINRVVAEKDLDKTIEEVLARISEFSAPVLEMTKKVISTTMGLPLELAMKKSQSIYLNQLMDLEDAQEGLRAVLEKRKPVWKNR